MAQDRVIVVGGGHAGFAAATALRQNGYCGAITLIAAECDPPYQRPPLSKAYLAGDLGAEKLAFRPPDFYERKGIHLRCGAAATEIDRNARTVTLETGDQLGYDHLVLAVGATPRALKVPGVELAGVYQLHSRTDADAIRERLAIAQSVVVIGGGFIGLEFAAHAREKDKDVTVLESDDRLMARAVSPPTSEFFDQEHRRWGSRIVLGSPAMRVVGTNDSQVRGVEKLDGTVVGADLVIICVGVQPNTGLARQAGLAVKDGILVDADLRTSDPRIFAIGDCASYPFRGRHTRHECVENAIGHARAVAATLTARPSELNRRVPTFWSDQRDLKLQIVGDWTGCSRTQVIGDPAVRSFSVNCYRGEELIAVESVNCPSRHITGRKLLGRAV